MNRVPEGETDCHRVVAVVATAAATARAVAAVKMVANTAMAADASGLATRGAMVEAKDTSLYTDKCNSIP